MLALPFRCHSLSFKNLCVSHLSLGIGEIRFKVSQTEPHISANVVLRNTKTVHIKQPQIVPSLTGSAEVRDVLSCFSTIWWRVCNPVAHPRHPHTFGPK